MEFSRDIAGLILMGGKSRRMQGKTKAMLLYEGVPFWFKSFQCLSKLERIYISVAKGQSIETAGLPSRCEETICLVEDAYPDIGPIGGLTSAFSQCQEAALFVLPCDVPIMSPELIDRMIAAWLPQKKNLILYSQGRPEPLIGIYSKDLLPILTAQINQQHYRVMTALSQMEHVPFHLEATDYPQAVVENINTPGDYKKLLMRGNNKWNN